MFFFFVCACCCPLFIFFFFHYSLKTFLKKLIPMLLLVATVACSQSSTCNATQRSDWSVGGGLIKEITGCKDFGACCSYCTSTELHHCLRHTGGTKLPCQCPLESTASYRCQCMLTFATFIAFLAQVQTRRNAWPLCWMEQTAS